MTPADEAARPASATRREDRPLGVAMVTRRPPTESGGVERVVAGLLKELARTRPTWRVDIVSAFPDRSRLADMDGLADVIASLRLGWRLRRSTADVIFVHCPECVWGIRLLRRRRGTPPLVTVWHGAGAEPHLRLRRPYRDRRSSATCPGRRTVPCGKASTCSGSVGAATSRALTWRCPRWPRPAGTCPDCG